jgi:hypothetical protein
MSILVHVRYIVILDLQPTMLISLYVPDFLFILFKHVYLFS